jgi:hypothetical protein
MLWDHPPDRKDLSSGFLDVCCYDDGMQEMVKDGDSVHNPVGHNLT